MSFESYTLAKKHLKAGRKNTEDITFFISTYMTWYD